MKILCQERYEKAVAYAKEIKNDTLQTQADSQGRDSGDTLRDCA